MIVHVDMSAGPVGRSGTFDGTACAIRATSPAWIEITVGQLTVPSPPRMQFCCGVRGARVRYGWMGRRTSE